MVLDLFNNFYKGKRVLVTGHTGFWKPMDMLKDNMELEKMWSENKAPWKVW